LELKSASLEVRDHCAHDFEHDDREQHAVESGRCSGGERLVARRQVVCGAEEDDSGYGQEHQSHDVMNQVLADPDHPDVWSASEQALTKQRVEALARGLAAVRRGRGRTAAQTALRARRRTATWLDRGGRSYGIVSIMACGPVGQLPRGALAAA